jgi:hypothetical protein
MSAPEHIREAWESYRRMVVPKNAPAVQVSECELAFFSGAISLFNALTRGISRGKEMTKGDVTFMETIDAELTAYIARKASEGE